MHRNGKVNASMNNSEIEKVVSLSSDHRELLSRSMERLNLSARAYHRVLKVSRTIADLAGEEDVSLDHLGEAIGYRNLEKH